MIGPAALVFALGLVARWALPEVECGEGSEEGSEAIATVLAMIALPGFGDAVTAILLLVLLVALVAARTRDQVGALLPAYLAGLALFVCPTVTGLFALGHSGIGC